MRQMMIILVSAILVDNFVLAKFLGVCPFLGVSKKASSALGMSVAVIFVMVLACAATWPIYHLLLLPYDLGYLSTTLFILIIASLVQLVEITLKRFIPPLSQALGIYLPLITTNCAVLGVTLLNLEEEFTFAQGLMNALGAGLGFMVAILLFAGVRERIDDNPYIPKVFQGLPATLIAAGLVSLSFFGFAGIVDGLFGV